MADLEYHQEFLLYWMKKYRRSHDKIKEVYNAYLVESKIPESENWFATTSDSIGLIYRRIDFPDTSLIPALDIEFTMGRGIPATVDPVVHDKIDNDTNDLISEFSEKTNSLFRFNRAQLIRAIASPQNSHGEFGSNDYLHWGRMMANYGHIQGHVQELLGHVDNALGFISNAINQQNVNYQPFNMVVEDSIARVDILKNKYHTLASTLTSRSSNDDVLGVVGTIIDQD
jgi:hypothetical protein